LRHWGICSTIVVFGSARMGEGSPWYHKAPVEQQPNPFSTPELTFQFHYFAICKMHLAMRAAALIVFPSVFGTFDALFEILTLRQTSKAPDIPIALVDKEYWTSVVNFQSWWSTA
jgi:predicted Rossmann-fold nucleotide-binding protein